jgi:hypothetical protein
MALAEDYLKYCTRYVLDHCGPDLAFFEATFEKGLRARLENVVHEPFQVLTYTEAIELLTAPEHAAAGKFDVTPYWGIDLGSEHERYITEQVFKKPVILVNYPKDIKAFYMKVNPDGKVSTAAPRGGRGGGDLGRRCSCSPWLVRRLTAPTPSLPPTAPLPRADGGGHGRAGAQGGRDHRRVAARGRPGHAARAHG